MIRINLLPFRAARTKENIRRQVSVFLLSLVLLVVVLGTVNLYLGSKVERMEARLEQAKADVRKFEEKAKKVEQFKKQLAELNKKIDIVNQLKEHRKEPPLLLSDITELVVPGRMQLTSMDFNGTHLNMDGIALDNETIAVFMKRLERSDRFTEITLTSSKQKAQHGIEMKEFGIKCKIVDPNTREKAKA